jgi:hypothetical protein
MGAERGTAVLESEKIVTPAFSVSRRRPAAHRLRRHGDAGANISRARC